MYVLLIVMGLVGIIGLMWALTGLYLMDLD